MHPHTHPETPPQFTKVSSLLAVSLLVVVGVVVVVVVVIVVDVGVVVVVVDVVLVVVVVVIVDGCEGAECFDGCCGDGWVSGT